MLLLPNFKFGSYIYKQMTHQEKLNYTINSDTYNKKNFPKIEIIFFSMEYLGWKLYGYIVYFGSELVDVMYVRVFL